MSDYDLILHCAPTLAGLKTANLFTSPAVSDSELNKQIRRINKRIVPFGVRILPLRRMKKKALIYLYRPDRLEQDLSNRKAEEILKKANYPDGRPECRLKELVTRLRYANDFPHEIGLFLGYPPEDVDGFISNQAKEYKCVGCWKVYGDEEAAQKKFAEFKLCTECYCNSRNKGMTLEKLIVRDP